MNFNEYKEMLQRVANDAALYFRGITGTYRILEKPSGEINLTKDNMHCPCSSMLISARHESDESIMKNEVILPLVDQLRKFPKFNNGEFISIPMIKPIDNMCSDGFYKGVHIRLIKSYDMTALKSQMNVMMQVFRVK